MENDRTEEVLARIEALEKRLDALTGRVQDLETPTARRIFSSSAPSQPRSVTPPPVQPRQRQESYFSEPQQRAPYVPPAVQTGTSPVHRAEEKKDLEYLIGAKILPKVGAVMTILAIVFAVVLGYSRGYITPAMMFAFEVAFCGAFIVIGLLKRNMKEEFGQILTGVGSCGLYAVFAGGHLYHDLYSGEALVVLFFLLSLGNLALGWWRSSKAFLALGLIGGLVTASVLPNMDGENSVLNAWIHFLILIPTALIISKNKWLTMSIWMWATSTFALIPILTDSLAWIDKVAILYASTAICLAAFGRCYRNKDLDGWHVFPPAVMWFAGLIGLALQHEPIGAWQYLGFFALFGGVTAMLRSGEAMRNAFLVGAIGVPLTLAPCCFTQIEATVIFASLSIVASLVAWKYVPKAAAIAALVEVFLGTVAYLSSNFSSIPWQTETLLLSLLVLAVIGTSRALVKAYGDNETYSLTAMALCVPLFARLATILLGEPTLGQRPEVSITFVLVAFSYYALALHYRTKWASAFAAFWAIYVLAITGYIAVTTWLSLPFDVGVLLALMLAPALSVSATPKKIREGAKAWAAIIVGCLFARLSVVLAVPYLGWLEPQACIVGAAAYSVGCFIYVWTSRQKVFVYPGWSLLVIAAAAYSGNFTKLPLQLDLWLTSALLLCLVVAGRATSRVAENRNELTVLLSLAGWVAFSRWSWVVLALAIPSLNTLPAISIGWTAYFLGLIALGFAYNLVQFRYVAFVVLGTTLCKILLIDLANTDLLIRTAVTVVAGLVILGASGYWYLRSKEAPVISDQ